MAFEKRLFPKADIFTSYRHCRIGGDTVCAFGN
jgi:hypothetical protein